MRSSLRGLAATVCTSVVAVSLPVLAVLAAPTAAEAAAPGGGVVLNEVKSNPNPDFVELLNTSSSPVDITGWRATDDSVGRTPIVITTGETMLDPGEYFTFNPDDAVYSGHFGLGGDDAITIFLPDGTTVVDTFTWEGLGPVGYHANPSYGRCANGTGEMVLQTVATPGAANECTVEPPTETIRINEVESNGDVVGDWVELTNTGASTVDVSGWTLEDAGDNDPIAIPSGTTIAPGAFYAIYTEIPGPGFGLGADDSITLRRDTTVVDTYSWTGGHAATTYGRCPDGTGEFRVTTVPTRGAANACSPIRVNEVKTSGTPDQVEIVNLSASPVDIAGWVLKDSTDTDPTTLASPAVVPAHGYLVVDPTATLNAADSVRLFDTTSALIDSVSWTSEPAPSLGRCADGVGTFKQTESATIGSANECPGVVTEPWPGSQTVSTSDDAATFGQDASGLAFDPSAANTLWVAQNKLGTLWKMTNSDGTWVPAAGWSKTPKYADASGAPDSEGITVGPDGAVYLATERDNSNSGVSKNEVLRYDADAATGATLNATDEWDINPLLPPGLGANLGLEGITWIPDTYLVDGGFLDESGATDTAYDPTHYPAHGTGLYAVAVEATGLVYLLALDQTAAVHETAHLVATVDPRLLTNAGPASVMDVSYDPEQERLWAICDDSCNGTSVLLTLTDGRFVVEHAYDRPAGMPNLNNEGFALAPQSTCVAGEKEVVWSDDGDTGGSSLRSGTFPCHSLSTVTGTDTSVVYGKAATVAVQVNASGATPTGRVSLYDGETLLGSGDLTAGATSVAVAAKSLAPGTHTLTAAYAGDPLVAAASDSLELRVVRAASSVSAGNGSVVYGRGASIPVEVDADGVTATGRVTVRSGKSVLGTATLSGGAATVSIPAKSLAPGKHTVTVVYAGDDNLVDDTGTATLTVTAAKSSLATPAVAPRKVIVKKTRAKVTVRLSAAGVTPTGRITITGGGLPRQSVAIRAGKAVVKLPAFRTVGVKTLEVTYAGDRFVAGDSTTVKVRVVKK